MNTHDHYRVGERIRSNISTYDGYDGGGEKFTNVGDLGTVTSRTEDGTYEVQMDTGRTKVFTAHQISPATPAFYRARNGDVWERYGAGYRLTHDRAVTVGWDEAVRLTGPLETVNEQEEPRVFVVVSSPAGDDPEATAQELALTVQRAAPGADVYTSSSRVPELGT